MTEDLQIANFDDRCRRFLDRAESIRNQHVIAAVVELGAAAVDELFDGDIERAHDRSAAQHEPLAVLVQRFGPRMAFVGLTVDYVRAAIRAYDVDRQLPPPARGRLLPGQLRALAVVPSPADRAALANLAVTEAWTVDQTEQQVADYRLQSGLKGKGGRPPAPAPLKAVKEARRGLVKLGAPEALDDLSPQARAELRQELEEAKATVELWLARL